MVFGSTYNWSFFEFAKQEFIVKLASYKCVPYRSNVDKETPGNKQRLVAELEKYKVAQSKLLLNASE